MVNTKLIARCIDLQLSVVLILLCAANRIIRYFASSFQLSRYCVSVRPNKSFVTSAYSYRRLLCYCDFVRPIKSLVTSASSSRLLHLRDVLRPSDHDRDHVSSSSLRDPCRPLQGDCKTRHGVV